MTRQNKNTSAPSSLAETMIRRSINHSAAGKALGLTHVEEYFVAPPSTEGLVFPLEPLAPVTKDEISRRFLRMKREVSNHEPLSVGELLQEGDEVILDVIPYHQGHIVPFLAQRKLRVVLGFDEWLVDLAPHLYSLPVGFRGHIQVKLPTEFAHPHFAGKIVFLGLDIHEAQRPIEEEWPVEVWLSRLDRGSTLDEVATSIERELWKEKQEAQQMLALRNCVQQLAARVREPVSEEIVDQEIAALWLENEGRILLELDVPSAHRDQALKTYCENPMLREDVRRGIMAGAAVLAVGERDQLQLSQAQVQAQWNKLGQEVGVDFSFEDFLRKIKAGDKASQSILAHFAYQHAARHVAALAGARIEL